MIPLTAALRFAIERAANLLTGPERRQYLAEITREFFDGNARKAERELGWGRQTIAKGLSELSSGIHCMDNYAARGNRPTEEKWPQLKADIEELVEPDSQAEPRLRTPLAYTRITAKAVREALIQHKGYREEALPHENTIRNILDRSGYRLRAVQKTKPKKKVPETDRIFENVQEGNAAADKNMKSIRISVDVKAKVDIGAFSRGGACRSREPKQAWDHDYEPQAQLVPVGILEPKTGGLTLVFNDSRETSDLIADAVEKWWRDKQDFFEDIEEVVINLDCGPHVQSRRRQFIKRMIELADKIGRRIQLLYYPPYHSKYNPMEHGWGALEQHWNGALLDTMETALNWAGTMIWKGMQPVIHFLDKVYETGVTLTDEAMEACEERLQRSKTLPEWDVIIEPAHG